MSNVPLPRPGPLGLIQYAGVDMLQYAATASAAKDAEIAQLRADLIKSLADNKGLRAEVAWLKAENAHARDCLNSATTLLTGIHSLMYPPEITTADGRVMVFRPKSIDPHEILQGLSDRIRALPDELAALAARKGEA